MTLTASKQIRKALNDLPGLPDALADLLVKLADDDFSMSDISEVVARDPGLTSQVIKKSNSSFYGFMWKADTAEEAAPRLGRSGLMEIVLNDQLGSACRKIGPAGKLLWHHSMATALIARRLAEHLKHDDPSMAYTAGLMHDVGKLVISQSFSGESAEIQHLVHKMHWQISESEKQILGFDHTEIGLLVAKKWHLSKKLTEIITLHHKLSAVKKNKQIFMVVAMANALAKNNGAASYAEQFRCEYPAEVLFDLNLSPANVAFLENESAELVSDASELLQLNGRVTK